MDKLASTIGLAVALAVVSTAPALAAFPGANGRLVYEDSLSSGFYTVNPDGSGRTQILAGEGTATIDPAYSPDGRSVVYSRGRDLWVVDTAGGAPRQITTGGNNDQFAAFAPDGKRVVFLRVAADDLFVVGLDGSGLRNLTNDGSAGQEYEPAWSPDGATIAYQRDTSAGQGSIYSIAATGGAPTNLTPENPTPPTCDPDHFRRSSDPSWSPDGSRIAFSGTSVCTAGGEPQYGKDIWVMARDGSGKVNVTANDGPSEQEPHWAPDGSRIAFISDQESIEGPGDIFTMAPDGSDRRKVIDREIKGEDIDWGPAATDKAPSLALRSGTRSLRKLLRSGLPITVRTDESCRMTLRLQLPRRVARRLGVAAVIGRLARNLAPGQTKVTAKLLRKPGRRLRRLGLRLLTVTVRATVRDAGGLTTTETARVTLRR